ncbi:hypothetical protein [Candidatus Acidianus copahuensis]|nr:hypothetical protein [Candidatus Acidianus copahuensis]
MKLSIEPWGVNIPFLLLAMVFWIIGGIFHYSHPYFMILGAFEIYLGMIIRLFFPARKYIPVQLLILISSAIPMHVMQIFSSFMLVILEIWAFKDVKNYGGRIIKNFLVFSSPFAFIVAWSIFNYWFLICALSLYLLGVNIGVFSATLNNKAIFGFKQFPLVILVIVMAFIKQMLPFLIAFYFAYTFNEFKLNKTGNFTKYTSIIVTFSSLFLGDFTHAFTLGVMAPLFSSCILYSTSKYNYVKAWVIPLLYALSYYLRIISLPLSEIPFGIASLYFLWLFKDNLTLESLKLGISKVFLQK